MTDRPDDAELAAIAAAYAIVLRARAAAAPAVPPPEPRWRRAARIGVRRPTWRDAGAP